MDKHHLGTFVWRITASHSIAYFMAGLFALFVMNYDELLGVGALAFMRPTDSVWVAAGPGLQVIRGILLSLFLYPFRTIFLDTDYGWIKFWFLSFGLSYFLTFSAAIGSFEGIIYTNFSLKNHLIGIPEVSLYLTLFTVFMWGWYRKPSKIITIIAVLMVSIILLMSLMGVLVSSGMMEIG